VKKLKLANTSLFLQSILYIFLSSTINAAGIHLEAMQMPAWLERNGEVSALKPGLKLQAGDRIVTGGTGRVLLRIDESGFLKLGEDAHLDMDTLRSPVESDGALNAIFKVSRGALRFTAEDSVFRHKIILHIGNIMATIRGKNTDIWGSAKTKNDTLCLIEGEIAVQSGNDPEYIMDTKKSYYSVSREKHEHAVKSLPELKLTNWMSLTDLESGSGVLVVNGGWAINLMSLAGKMNAKNIMQSMTSAGYPVEIESIDVQGQGMYRLRINGFKSKDDASAFADNFEGVGLIERPWVAPL